jgi:aspartate/methionine/tyrosine aminotransferase
MEWSKTCSTARFNLATSGLTSASIREFPLHQPEMEITGPGGYGYQPLQDRLARHTGAPSDCIVAATGASMANYLAMSVALDPGDEVLIERPAYGLFSDIAGYLQANIKFFDRRFSEGFVANPTDIETNLTPRTRLIVLSNLHNPSGALIDRNTLREIGELAQRRRIYVLVDEVYLEMLFDPATPSAFTIGRGWAGDDNPFIATNSLTKTYGLSGLRCGWVLAAPELARQMWRLNDLFGVNAAHVSEQMSVSAFDRLGILRERARKLLTANRYVLDQFLDSHPDLECFRPPAGTVVFPKLSEGDTELFLKLLRDEYETSVVPGRFFGQPRHFRIGIGGDTDILRGGLERLSAVLSEFRKR